MASLLSADSTALRSIQSCTSSRGISFVAPALELWMPSVSALSACGKYADFSGTSCLESRTNIWQRVGQDDIMFLHSSA